MAEKAGKDTGVQIGTPYDDVFRTLLNDYRLQEYNTNEEKLNTLKADYQMIIKHLNDLEYREQLSTYYKKAIVEMTEKVVNNLAAGYENIRREVRTVMGGKILEYEAKTILQKGHQEGLQEGLQRGRRLGHLDNLIQNIQSLMKTMGWSAEHAMDMMQVSEEDRAAVSEQL